jgi:hypothetical protein
MNGISAGRNEAVARSQPVLLWKPQLAPGRGAIGLTVAAVLWTCWLASAPGWSAGLTHTLFYDFVCWSLGAFWVLRTAIAAVVVAGRSARRTPLDRRWLLRFGAQPLLVGVLLVLMMAHLPLQARFAFARSDFDLAASLVLANKIDSDNVHRLGTYRIHEVSDFGAGTLSFATSESTGFTYAPRSRPQDGSDTYIHLTGPWYAWFEPDPY